ncbi:MAG: diguanylate cyclase [Rhodoferax sp.]|nr:diguanylate cyclase [Rhodoferax sp.]
MTTTGLNHFNLRAPRELLDELKEFYCTVVGLRDGPRPQFWNFGYWLYAGDKPIVHLYQAEPDEERDAQAVTTFDHIAFDCTNRPEVEATLVRCNLHYRATEVPGSKRVQFFLKDPAGNGVELIFPSSDA